MKFVSFGSMSNMSSTTSHPLLPIYLISAFRYPGSVNSIACLSHRALDRFCFHVVYRCRFRHCLELSPVRESLLAGERRGVHGPRERLMPRAPLRTFSARQGFCVSRALPCCFRRVLKRTNERYAKQMFLICPTTRRSSMTTSAFPYPQIVMVVPG